MKGTELYASICARNFLYKYLFSIIPSSLILEYFTYVIRMFLYIFCLFNISDIFCLNKYSYENKAKIALRS